jgi:uncharacterized repeat protein (TIGR03803 family)
MKTKLISLLFAFLFAILQPVNAQFSKIYDFIYTPDPYHPKSTFISIGGILYGSSISGGAYGMGAIFQILPDGSGDSVLHDFQVVEGRMPNGALYFDGTYLYGTAQAAGIGSVGTVFRMKPDGSAFMVLVDFDTTNLQWPTGDLVSDGTFLYGAAFEGSPGVGGLFKIKPDGTAFSAIGLFNAPLGEHPIFPLYEGGVLYGMTGTGGTTGKGVVYRINPDGTGLTTLYNFDGALNGSEPNGSLISDGTFLYGMTRYGGSTAAGIVFKIKPDGSGFQKLHDFIGTDGNAPVGHLVSDGTFLYGMTEAGGVGYDGVIFQIKPDGTAFSLTHEFDPGGTDGGNPRSSLFLNAGALYGTTYNGGAYGYGTVFKYALSTGISDPQELSGIRIFPNPAATSFTISSDLKGEAEIEIVDPLGKVIYHSFIAGKKEIDMSDAAEGVYFVRLKKENRNISITKLVLAR